MPAQKSNVRTLSIQSEINICLREERRWTVTSTPGLTAVGWTSIGGGYVDVVSIPLDLLADIDVNLPSVMQELGVRAYSNEKSMQQTLALWADPNSFLMEVSGDLRYMGRITCVDPVNAQGDRCLWLTYQNVFKTNDGALIATGHSIATTLVMTPAQLDEHYPGCAGRIASAEAIGLSPVEVAEQLYAGEDSYVTEALPELV